jgi:hypothetical protein
MQLTDELIRIQGAAQDERTARLERLREAVRRAEDRVADLNRQILAAGDGPASDGERQAAARAAAAAAGPAERAARDAAAAKALASRRKDEIAEWKAWHAGLPPEEQASHVPALAGEIDWRAAELDALTARIPGLDAERLRTKGALELALAAAAAADHGLPGPDDPRVAELHRGLDDARAALEPALIALQAAETETPPGALGPPTPPAVPPTAVAS